MANPIDKLQAMGQQFAEDHDTDFAVYFGEMTRSHYDFAIVPRLKRKKRPRLMLMLATRGGDAAVAYRIGRALQQFYRPDGEEHADDGPSDFTVFVPTLCKSAGTILTIAATKIIMSDSAELGPIDVQLRNPSEVGERTSGLTPIQAMESLSEHSRRLFRQHFEQLRFEPTLGFSTGMAAEIATSLTVGLLKAMYEQVDPIRLAEVERSLKISADYAERLSEQRPGNLKEGAIEKLVGSYPNHGFVIDRKEAEGLFENVDKPDQQLSVIADEALGLMNWMLIADRGPYFDYLCREPEEPVQDREPQNE